MEKTQFFWKGASDVRLLRVEPVQIKVASVRLAQLYMKRVAAELKNVDSTKEPMREFLLLQGVRFAFRVHQVLLSVQLSLQGSRFFKC
jgi:hypothetical protein